LSVSSDDLSSIASSQPTKRLQPAAASSATSSSSDAPKRSKFEGPLLSSFMGGTTQSIAKLAATAFASCRMAFAIADNPEFVAFLQGVRYASALPSRKTIAAATSVVHAEMRVQLLRVLRESTTPIGIAIDGWTNVRQTKVTNVVVLCGGIAYYWCSIANALERNTAAWLQEAIEPCLNELVNEGVRFAAFIADNEAVNGALFHRLSAKFPFLVRIPCAAHTIQLVVKECFSAPMWVKTRAVVDTLLHGFATHKEWRIRLRSIQEGADGIVYNLVKPNDTRWNSYLYACDRLLKLKAPIEVISPQAAEFWTDLAAFVKFLRPFQIATDVVQKDASTLYDIFVQWNVLTRHVQEQADSGIKNKALYALRKRWRSQVNEKATIAAALLSLNDDVSKLKAELIGAAREFIVSFGVSYMSFFKLSDADDDALEGKLLVQVAQFSAREGPFASLSSHVEKTKKSLVDAWHPSIVWSFYAMELATVARALLAMPASEAAVERTFSAQGSIHTKKRNSLSNDSVESNMFVAFNHRPLNGMKPEARALSTVELSPEFLEEEKEESDIESDALTEPDDSDVEMEYVPAAPVTAAAAAAAPIRSNTEINTATHTFLLKFIENHSLQKGQRWTGDLIIQLEKDAEDQNPGGNSTPQLIDAIKKILRERDAAASQNRA
jgi:hypothetical protein